MNYLDNQDYFSNYNAEIVAMLIDHLGSCQQHVYIENLYTTKLYYTRIIQLLRDYPYKDIYFSIGVFITQYYEDQEEVERHMDIVRLVINEININERMHEVNNVVVVMMDDQRIRGAAVLQNPLLNPLLNSLLNPLQNPLQNVEFIVKEEDMDKIPVFHFSAISKTKVETACSICQSDFEESDEIPKFDCNHLFHKECIFKWFSQKGKDNNKCPNCREELIKHSSI